MGLTTLEANKRRVTMALVERGKTQFWLAKQLGVTYTYVSMMLNGHRNMAPKVVSKIHDLLGVDLSDNPNAQKPEVTQ